MKDVGDEIFDVVDERDEVIGQEQRSEVHRKGLRHRAVHILFFNPRGQPRIEAAEKRFAHIRHGHHPQTALIHRSGVLKVKAYVEPLGFAQHFCEHPTRLISQFVLR